MQVGGTLPCPLAFATCGGRTLSSRSGLVHGSVGGTLPYPSAFATCVGRTLTGRKCAELLVPYVRGDRCRRSVWGMVWGSVDGHTVSSGRRFCVFFPVGLYGLSQLSMSDRIHNQVLRSMKGLCLHATGHAGFDPDTRTVVSGERTRARVATGHGVNQGPAVIRSQNL